MNKPIFLLILLACSTTCLGQTAQTNYFSSELLDKEVPEKKAKFSQTITQHADGTTTTEVKNIKQNEIVRSETYKGNEPYGIWKFRYGNGFKTIDYNFPLVYSKEPCESNLPPSGINDYFQNDDSLGYRAPKIASGDLTLYQYVGKNMFYPRRAIENGIQGTVVLILTITAEGTANILVRRGVDINLDKEAVRVLRELKFKSPATLNGQPFVFTCAILPVKFKLM